MAVEFSHVVQWELIKRYAQETGLTVSEYIRCRGKKF